jgi:endonuclease III
MINNQAIFDALLHYKSTINQEELTPAKYPEAVQLIHDNSFAFISACCLDRGTKAEIIWTIPYWIYQQVNHYDPIKFRSMNFDQITSLFNHLPQRPRYTNDAPRTFQKISEIVVDDFSGDAENIWKNRSAIDVKRILLDVHGVGSGIANMSLILIESAYKITFPDRVQMDIKPDVHTMRVLYRLGVSPAKIESEAVSAARQISPEFPGLIDGPLWSVGRNWCHPTNPDCVSCPLNTCCGKVGL